MLDDLKRESHAGNPTRDLFKLAVYVIGMLIFGLLIFTGSRCTSKRIQDLDGGGERLLPATPPGELLDPAELDRRVRDSKAEPYRYSAPGIEYVRKIRRTGLVGPVSARLTPEGLAALPFPGARGRVLEIEGQVTEVTREVYRPQDDATGEDRLWSVVIEGAHGTQAVAVRHALVSDQDEGPPRDARPPRVRAARIEPGQHVLIRGVYVQRRTGSLGGTTLAGPTPVLLASAFRIELPPEERNEVIATLDDALWSDVQDRYSRESRRWDEDAVFEVLQWARARGYEACRKDLRDGTLPWKVWGPQVFETWKREVSVKRGVERPFTTAARGKVFRTPGIIGEVLSFGWERIPANRWNVDQFQLLRMLSDYYQHVSMSMILAFPIDRYEHVLGLKAEHVRVYGVFVKNETYDTIWKREDEPERALPVTAPMFVVLHIEPFPEDEAGAGMRELMWWIAGSMVLFGLLFYLVLIRGGTKQEAAMEAHRFALRRRARAKAQDRSGAAGGSGEGNDGPDRGAGEDGAAGNADPDFADAPAPDDSA